MDETKLNHMGLNGPGMWNLLHAFAIEAIDDKSKEHFEFFVTIFIKRIKCTKCAHDVNNFIKSNPLDKYKNIKTVKGHDIGYYQWSCDLHNHVNSKLGKPTIPVEKSYKYYKSDTSCVACNDIF